MEIARLVLAAIEGVALLLGLAALQRELLRFLPQARGFVGRVLELRVVADDGLFLLVLLGVERADRVRGLRDGAIEIGRLLRQTRQRFAIVLDALAQLLDFALRLENAAGIVPAAAAHEPGTAEDVAVHGDDGSGVRRLTCSARA